VSNRTTAPAQIPPPGITGLDPSWSRLVTAPDAFGTDRTWHLLDSWAPPEVSQHEGAARPLLTLLCVHGNPSWSFLWRKLVAKASSDDIRVIAVDQLDMGFSERTGQKRTLATRVDDLTRLTETLGLTGLVVTVAHDWGGPVSLGWALRHVDTSPISGPRLAGVVLTNTAVHQPVGSPAPAVIRLIRSKPVLRNSTVNTLAFIRGAYEMSRPRLPAEVREGFTAPYVDKSRREAIADFVADIPLDPSHESAATLDGIAAGLADLGDIPALLLWGPRDQVFGDLYLHDLEARLPHANVHRFVNASHFVGEDADVAGAVTAWLPTLDPTSVAGAATGGSDHQNWGSQTRGLSDFSGVDPGRDAVVEMAPDRGGRSRSLTFGELHDRVEQLATGMASFGIDAGDRVAVMVPPGIDLSLAVYGCWRRGATLVLVDSGLGPKGMQQALVSADPDYLIGIDKALAAAKAMRWPGKRIAVGPRSKARTKALGIATDLEALTERGRSAPAERLIDCPDGDSVAAIAFTSGATGPSKGVVYRHHQIQAQRDALMNLYRLTPADRLVAAFAPFALYGPTMGLTSVVPDMDVTAPGTLSASALGDAVAAIDATLVFASPAALVNTVATADELLPSHRSAFEAVRLLLSAGAPVRPELLRSAKQFFPNASAHTPYGMTEALPVADISLTDIDATGDDGDGVCVGLPLPTVDVMIDPLDHNGHPAGAPSTDTEVLGEIIVRAPHARDGYDRLWFTQHRASQPAGWHRTGDIGRLDAFGRLWVGGRLGHVITPPAGPVAPVRFEQQLEQLPDIDAAAVIGVGPAGTQVLVAVVETGGRHELGAASIDLIDRTRASLLGLGGHNIDLAAVLVVETLPVDRRHNSKIDRSAVATWAAQTLAGKTAKL